MLQFNNLKRFRSPIKTWFYFQEYGRANSSHPFLYLRARCRSAGQMSTDAGSHFLSLGHRPSIDGFRAFALIRLLLFHIFSFRRPGGSIDWTSFHHGMFVRTDLHRNSDDDFDAKTIDSVCDVIDISDTLCGKPCKVQQPLSMLWWIFGSFAAK
jgi:hypothetical protein